ncbi:hypothetical protein Pmani_036192 [Petrolisthes manimaculis]|uniref:Uncharacterized protein n=1 Tax=Petrolisthes manimaculis TaxID=1843537 RepID=A0AAE1NKP1_9EUCA|nr:hypothetical protein Pmani_036192 [Petrolisthes manimaculis]
MTFHAGWQETRRRHPSGFPPSVARKLRNPSGWVECRVSIPEDYFFPLAGKDKSLDLASLLERAQDHKGSQQKKVLPPAFPVRLMGSRAPHNLTELLWRDPSDKSIPYQLREPDQKYWAAETSARQDLAYHLATTVTASLLKGVAL